MDREIPLPSDPAARPNRMLADLVGHVGQAAAASACVELLQGADPREHETLVRYLAAGAAATLGQAPIDELVERGWKPYWFRVWGARGLLYAWSDDASDAVVTGLRDEHWRVAEMCAKVTRLRGIGPAGPGCVGLLGHDLPRVRSAALRALAMVGDTDHVDPVADAMHDPDRQVRLAAATSYERLVRRLDLSGVMTGNRSGV
ncbi:MAG: HEAT repeat domain-containing protein [Nocardioidaceae bacterium]